ncbi:MAG: sensor histidine kinase [Rhizomicrobium sp.]
MSRSETRTESGGAEIARLRSALKQQEAQSVRERDADRGAIARELHDKFGQYLVMMELELAAMLGRDDLPPALTERLEKMRNSTAEAHRDMADMAWQMRPATLQGQDLKIACEQLVAEWSGRTNLFFDLHVSLGGQKLLEQVESVLYRVLQEALTNAVKHANAARIGVILRVVSHEAVLIVEDDGSGFPVDENVEGGSRSLGLLGIRERLAPIGGTLEIESTPGQGATLLISVPL